MRRLKSFNKFTFCGKERRFLAGMGELLDEKMKPRSGLGSTTGAKSWAKQNLKKDLLFLLQLKLKNYDQRTKIL